MISSGTATIISLMILGVLAVVAIAVGFVATGALGLGWSVRTGLADALVAVASAVAGVLLAVALRRNESVVLIGSLMLGVSSVALRHVGRRLLGRTASAPAP
jgi:hypothetical protein